jgi:hypothetical protein
MRARAATAIVLVGFAACFAGDLYLNSVDEYASGADFGLVLWNLVPFALLAGLVLVSRVSFMAAGIAAALMTAFVVFAFWAEASDLTSSDPSSTGVLILVVGPFYDAVLIGIVCGVDAVVRHVRHH